MQRHPFMKMSAVMLAASTAHVAGGIFARPTLSPKNHEPRTMQRQTPRKPERRKRQPHVWPNVVGAVNFELATRYRVKRAMPAGRASTLKKTAKAFRIAGRAFRTEGAA